MIQLNVIPPESDSPAKIFCGGVKKNTSNDDGGVQYVKSHAYTNEFVCVRGGMQVNEGELSAVRECACTINDAIPNLALTIAQGYTCSRRICVGWADRTGLCA